MERVSFYGLWVRLNTVRSRRNELLKNMAENENAIDSDERELFECEEELCRLQKERDNRFQTWPISRILVCHAHNDYRVFLLAGVERERIRLALCSNAETRIKENEQMRADVFYVLEFKRQYLEKCLQGTPDIFRLTQAQDTTQLLYSLDMYFPTDKLQERLSELDELLN
jgi:hypothetical protein